MKALPSNVYQVDPHGVVSLVKQSSGHRNSGFNGSFGAGPQGFGGYHQSAGSHSYQDNQQQGQEQHEEPFDFSIFGNESSEEHARQSRSPTNEDLDTILKAHKDVRDARIETLDNEYEEKNKEFGYAARRSWIDNDYHDDVNNSVNKFYNNL